MAAEQGVKASEAGEAITIEAGEAIRQLGERLTRSSDSAQQILASAQQQLTGIDQVALAMQNIRQASGAEHGLDAAGRAGRARARRALQAPDRARRPERAPRAPRTGRMPRRDAELKARLLATFQIEADEHLVALRRHLLALAEAEAGRELVESTFRDMHTLKGAARSVGLRDVERVCACCESVLSAVSARGRAGPPVVALLEDAVAAVGTLVRGAEVPGELDRLRTAARTRGTSTAPRRLPPTSRRRSPPVARPHGAAAVRRRAAAGAVAAAPRISPRAPETIRLATDELDTLLRRGEDLLAIKLVADEWVASAEALNDTLRRARPPRIPRPSCGRSKAPRATSSTGCGATGGRSPAPSTGCSTRPGGCG